MMNLPTIFLILSARRYLFLAVLVSVLLLVLIVSFLMTPVYIGEAALVIDTRTTDPVTGNAMPGDVSAAILATQTDIITSRNVALKVVDKLNLTKDQYYLDKFTGATEGVGSARIWLADYLTNQVTVVPSKDSNVLAIDLPGRTPELAAQLANAYADAYIQASLELAADPARRQSAWFDQQKIDLRRRVDLAQQRLSDAQRKTSIVGTEAHIDVDNTKLTEISTQLVAAQEALYEARTKLKQMNDALAKNQLESVPDILGNPLLQTLKTDLARAESAFADTASRYDRNHPQYLSAQATVQSMRSKLASEVESVRGSIEQTAQQAQRQVGQLQSALDQQKQTVLGAKREHDALDVLNHELDSAQTEYDAAMGRADQVRLASELNQSRVALLNPAIVPFKQSRPRILLYMVIAFFFGSFLSTGVCLATEIRDRRVRTRFDILEATGLLVLAEVPGLTRKARLA